MTIVDSVRPGQVERPVGPLLSRMQFRGAWRDYQAQALGEMEDNLTDGRLHIVAAPGAGKTVLGLEILRRFGRRALVFAPTVAIRDQWAHRLTPLFLDTAPGPEEVSHQLSELRELTLATYQALDGFRRAEDLERLVRDLNTSGPVTLVLDEAHHLRREWQASIEHLARSLDDVRVVALTATPPYDASFAEWARYESVCGPIDLEIGIPELVRNGDLCPHHDHVILSEPTADALALLDARRRAISQLQQDLWADEALLDELEAHPWLQRPDDHIEAILETPEMLSAVLVLLAGAKRKLPTAPLKLLGVSARSVPMPSFAWLERFVDGVSATHNSVFDIGSERVTMLRHRLHRHGLIEGGRVRLRGRARPFSSWPRAWPSWRASPISRGPSTSPLAKPYAWSSCPTTSAPANCRRLPTPASSHRSPASSRSSNISGARASHPVRSAS